MKLQSIRKALATGGLALSIAALGVSQSVNADGHGFAPKKPVDFVIMAGKGGGADKMARLMQSIIEKNNLSDKPFVPVNKPGGSGAEALIHLNSAKGVNKNHTIMVTLNSFYTTPLRQPNLGVDPMTFAPIARMAEDTFVLWVNKSKGISTVDEFVAMAKEKGDGWVMGGTGKGSEDNLLTAFLNTAYGLNMKYVPFKGGGSVAKSLAGENIDSSVNNPSEALGFYESGDVVALAAFTPERIDLFKDTPTFTELGKEFNYFMQRSVVGAPGMSDEAQGYYRKVFQAVYDSEEWQSYMKKKALRGEMLTGDALIGYWKENNDRHRTMLKDIGEL